MLQKTSLKGPLMGIALLIVLSNLLIILLKMPLSKIGIDSNVLLVANNLFLAITVLTFFLQKKALRNSNPNVFVRSIMAGILIKMFVCFAAVIVYRLVAGNATSKVSVFASMFIYLIYLALEVKVMTKLNKQHNG